MSDEIRVKKLGLAAYIHSQGGLFVDHRDGHFIFKSVRRENEWEVEYFNSCCYKHDTSVMSLRKFIKK